MDDNSLITINHEMKTALNGILGYTQLMSKTPLNIEQKRYIEKINYCSLILLHNINNILDYNRLLTGEIKLNNEYVDIYFLINEILRMYNTGIKKVKLSYIIESVIPRIFVDKNKLIQIIINIILYFNKFEKITYVHFNTKSYENKYVEFIISADINEGNEEFKNEFNSEIADLDLKICKLLSKYLNWDLDYIFTDKERSFTLKLPCKNEDININKYVIIADDNKGNNMLLKEIVLDYIPEENITCVYDGEEVIKELNDNKYDFIFLDISMPKKNGYDVIDFIKNKNINIDVYVISALEQDNSKHVHIKQYITKPYNIEQIKNIILSYINE